MLSWRGVTLGVLVVALIAVPGQAAAQNVEQTVPGASQAVPAAAAALDEVDEDRDGIPDDVEPVICLFEDPGSPQDGSCSDTDFTNLLDPKGNYTPPMGLERDGDDRDGYPRPVEAAVCGVDDDSPLGECDGSDDLSPSGGNAAVLTARSTEDGTPSDACEVDEEAPTNATCVFASIALDLDLDGDAEPDEAVTVACLTNVTVCVASNPYLTHTITFTTDPTSTRDALAPKVTITESGGQNLTGNHSIRLCVPDDSDDPTDPDVLRVKGCAEDMDEDGRLLHQELLLCSDPTDPGSNEPPHPDDYPVKCWPLNSSEEAVSLATAIVQDVLAAAGAP